MKNILMPLAWLYGLITALRNKLYDKGIFKIYTSSLPTICIGNIQVGGTGKTPHTAWLYQWLGKNYKVAILMRGYGRKTKGLIHADKNSTPNTIGDEAFWYYNTLSNAEVIVAEKRALGLQFIENLKPKIDIVLLDDAFQHRAIKCKLNIMLSMYDSLYTEDKMMPQGRLREWKTGEKRADIIIVTKCPEKMSLDKKIELIQAINPFEYQTIFFTSIHSGKPYNLKGNIEFDSKLYPSITALSGLANNNNFISLCQTINPNIISASYSDHYDYTETDIENLIENLQENTVILTTEKDAVKLSMPHLKSLIPENKVYVLPIVPYFLFHDEDKFRHLVIQELKHK